MSEKPKREHGRQNPPNNVYMSKDKAEADALWAELKAIALENDCVNRDGTGNVSELVRRIARRELKIVKSS